MSDSGERITCTDGRLNVPDHPIIPFIEGDGTGPDIWAAASRVLEAAVAKAYGGDRKIVWKEILAGQKAFDATGEWLPAETVDVLTEYLVGIKGPLTTPVGGGIRSLNVTLRQTLDLYVCLRPVRHYAGVPSPVKHPEHVDMVIFRENTEDVYAGLEVAPGSPEAERLRELLAKEMGWTIRPESGIGIKPISRGGSQRLIRAAMRYALSHGRQSVTLVHKGNIMKFTEGAFRQWGYDMVADEFRDQALTWLEAIVLDARAGQPDASAAELAQTLHAGGVSANDASAEAVQGVLDALGSESGTAGKLIVKDTIADIFLQQILTRPKEFDVIATMNLNGDYISDALAAQVGGIGIAPGANINFDTGHAIFEATHGTAPKYAGQDKVNPGSLLLSGVMMLEHLGWQEAADVIPTALQQTISDKQVTYDFARLMPGATELKCSQFADAIIARL